VQIAFQCSECKSELEVECTAMGTQVACPACGKPIAVPQQNVGPGCTLKGFRIERLLGKGGMGEVYLAQQLSMDRRVALKILPSLFTREQENVDRFLKEVRMAARLVHPNVVPAFEAGEDTGVHFLAMAYVEGETVGERLKRQGPMREEEALKIVRDVVEALKYAWDEHHIIHRDIKPSNIMIDRRGRTQVMDLGLSKSVDEACGLTISGTVLGTPNYMSPEQAEGHARVDFRSDMYSLGAALYHMLTGQTPFAGSSLVEVLRKQLTESLPDPRQFNRALGELCVTLMERMLAKKAEDRYPTWEGLLDDIDRVLAGQTTVHGALAVGRSMLIRTVAATSLRPAVAEPAAKAKRPTQKAGERKVASIGPIRQCVGPAPQKRLPVPLLVGGGLALVVTVALIAAAVSTGRAKGRAGTIAQSSPHAVPESLRLATQTLEPPAQRPAPASTAIPVKAPSQPTVVPPVKPPPDQAPRVMPPIGMGSAAVGNHKPGDAMSVDLGNGVKLEMVWIPPGTFMMGSPTTETGRRKDETQHPVTLAKGFWMGKYEVTQEQWQQVMGSNPSRFSNLGPKAPVETVSWDDCQQFLTRLGSQVTGGGRFRLPTEAEWEHACRAGTTTRVNTGGTEVDLERAGWHSRNSGQPKSAHVVGEKAPNAWGLYDVHGNVAEWCQDWYGDYLGSATSDPTGPDSGDGRVVRGGSWLILARDYRSAIRFKFGPSDRGGGAIGFRLAAD
jgi:formylglycine-generating enzyme required for sulfatase activity/predicted Ser/Thr protein kinase/DNA-directed RNA polymerase subunit RPC12/RpoP